MGELGGKKGEGRKGWGCRWAEIAWTGCEAAGNLLTGTLVNAPDTETARWFAEEVQVHEPVLRAWLRSRFPSQLDVDDLVQEAFMRVLQARTDGTVRAPRALLFTTARNLALDQLRREKVIPMESLTEIEPRCVLAEGAGVPEAVGQTQELELLTQAIQSLPDRCRQVLTLRKIYGLSQKAIAAQLGIAEHTVEAQVANGMRRCADFLARHGLP